MDRQTTEKVLLNKALRRKAIVEIRIEEGRQQFKHKYGIDVDPKMERPPNFSVFEGARADELYQKQMKRFAAFTKEWNEFKKDMETLRRRIKAIMPENIARNIAEKFNTDGDFLTCDKLIKSLLLAITTKKRWWAFGTVRQNAEATVAQKVADEIRKYNEASKIKYPTLASLGLDLDEIPIKDFGGKMHMEEFFSALKNEAMQENIAENGIIRKQFASWKAKINKYKDLERCAWEEYAAYVKTPEQVREAKSTDLSPYKAAIRNIRGAR